MAVSVAAFGPHASAETDRLHLRHARRHAVDVIFDLIKSYRDFDVTDHLDDITVPALVIGGTHDRLTLPEGVGVPRRAPPEGRAADLRRVRSHVDARTTSEVQRALEGVLRRHAGAEASDRERQRRPSERSTEWSVCGHPRRLLDTGEEERSRIHPRPLSRGAVDPRDLPALPRARRASDDPTRRSRARTRSSIASLRSTSSSSSGRPTSGCTRTSTSCSRSSARATRDSCRRSIPKTGHRVEAAQAADGYLLQACSRRRAPVERHAVPDRSACDGGRDEPRRVRRLLLRSVLRRSRAIPSPSGRRSPSVTRG